jgi:hypothetical protein
MFVCCECCVFSGRGPCDGLITRPEESYRLWRVVVCDQETSKTRRLKPATGLWKTQPQWVVTPGKQANKQTCDIHNCCKFRSIEIYFSVALCSKASLMILKQRLFMRRPDKAICLHCKSCPGVAPHIAN